MIPRVLKTVMDPIEAERQKGRTNRQAEKIVGLLHGFLADRFLVDDSAERAAEASRKAREVWANQAFRYRQYPDRIDDGCRPRENWVVS